MKKSILGIIFLFTFFTLAFHDKAFAQVATQSGTTNVQVTVGGNTLSLSGYIAPFASIVLTINKAIITSTTADAAGNFSFTNVIVPKATSTVCLTSVDYKKLGESEACITVIAIDGVVSKSGVFLPPTMGVQRTDVEVGNNAIAFGYGMPGATITVHVTNLSGCTTTADVTGYYTCTIKIEKAGQYELFADSVLNKKPSEQQLKKILINGIALVKPTLQPLPTTSPLPSLNLFQIPWWVWLLLVLIVIILIIILLRKYRPQALPTVGIPEVNVTHAFDFLFKHKKLHHWWMDGVGY